MKVETKRVISEPAPCLRSECGCCRYYSNSQKLNETIETEEEEVKINFIEKRQIQRIFIFIH